MLLASLANALVAILFLAVASVTVQAQAAGGKDGGNQSGTDTSVLSLDGEVINLDEARRLFKEHQDELERIEREQLGLKTETETLNTESAQLQQKLIDAGRRIKNAEKNLTRSEGEIADLAEQQKQLQKALEKNRTAIAQMLGVMERMGREPPPVMMTERNDALRMVRSAMILASFFPGFREKADELSTTIADLNSIITKSREEHKNFAVAQNQFATLKKEVEELLGQKRKKMQANWQRQEKLRIAASRHSRAVSDFGDLLKRLDAEVANQSNLKEYEAELRALDPAIELKPSVQKAAFVSPGRMKPAVPFSKAKGLLPFPASGKRLISFGSDDEVGGKSQGIRVETRSEAQITSPSDGWVIYAGKFRSYGQLLIINAGGGYHILLAGLGQIYTEVGQFVLAGEPVAAMGKSTQVAAGSVQSRNPVLYIEFRKNAHPVNPDPWWSEGVKEG
ncbi:MAG TPA: peptidoglycan DD-metalloendopeptidase family protein [Hyphomicrobiales bacterium]|nr:peptidoglycan DD-metalloendopeptidase family protein [Hyphomicrobiales bacterium]